MTAQIACYGRLAADPRPHETSSGKPMASARLAVEIEARTDGESGAETWWLSVLAFGRTAESLMRHAEGEPMSVSGRLQSQRWTDRATGERREGWQCIADAIVSARSVRPGGCRRSREGDCLDPGARPVRMALVAFLAPVEAMMPVTVPSTTSAAYGRRVAPVDRLPRTCLRAAILTRHSTTRYGSSTSVSRLRRDHDETD